MRFDVEESEEIARILFEPSMVEGKDRISRNAFFLERLPSGKWESYLSVWRILYKTPSRANAAFIKPRKPADKLFGYGTLSVGFVHGSYDGLDVSATVYRTKPDPEEYHVGIFYTVKDVPLKGSCDDEDFLELTMILANEAILTKFPPIEHDVINEAM